MGIYFAGELTPADLKPEQPTALPVRGLLDKAEGFIQRNTGSIVNILDSVGRLRQTAKVSEVSINDAYFRNITQAPGVSWFERETMIPGVSNGLIALGAALSIVGGLLVGMKARGPE